MYSVRRKIQPRGLPEVIHTRRGQGYMIKVQQMRSIRLALSLPLVISVPLLVLLGGGVSSWFVADRLNREFDSQLLMKARDLSALVQWRNPQNNFEFNFSDELMPEFSSQTAPEYF